ncbi:MAG: glycosyltransferase family 4 protein [Lachnospira sp.]
MINIVVFGTGKYLKKYQKYVFNEKTNIVAFLDNNIEKCGKEINGFPIYQPQQLCMLQYDNIVLLSAYAYQMHEQLQRLNVDESKIWYIGKLIEFVDDSYDIKLVNSIIKEKKCLIITPPLIYDGGSKAIVNLAYILTKNDYEVHIVSSQSDERLVNDIKNKNKAIKIINKVSIPYGTYEFLNIEEYEFIVVNSIILVKNAVEFARNKRVILWLHDPSDNYKNIIKQYKEYIQIDWISNIKEIYSVSEIASANFKKYLGDFNIKKLTCGVEDGVGVTKKYTNKNKITFAIIGHLSNLKNQILFIEASKKINWHNRKLEFLIIGRAVEDAYAKRMLEQIKDLDNVKYLGEIKASNQDELYSQIDVVVCASLEETLSLTIVEGMMNGKVCITSSNTGVASYIRNYENGMVFDNNDINDLTRKMQWVIDNEDKLELIGNNARKTYQEQFSLDIFEKNVMNII